MSHEDRVLDIRRPDVQTFSELLTDLNPGTEVNQFEIINRAACGDGVASTADRINLGLSFKNNPNAVPEKIILKTLLLNTWLRFSLPAILSLSTVVGLFEKIPLLGEVAAKFLFVFIGLFQRYCPQAPDAMYEIESRFYREIRPNLDIEAPEVYAAKYDKRSRQFAVLMEDLALKNVHFPNATESLELETVKSTLKQMAIMHAAFWQSKELERTLDWVPARLEGGMFPVFDGIGYDLIRFHVDESHSKQALISPLGKTVKELCELNWKAQAILAKGRQTLLHGDTHVGNTYVLDNGEGGLIDFQLLVKGNPMIDVTYYIITSLNSESRREHESQIIQFYLWELKKLGVEDVPSFDEACHDYRIAALWGLVIGWLITPTVNYGEAITFANVERTSQAVQDLETIKLIESIEQ